MFEHSIKVPRHYKIAANIFKKVSTEGGSVKTLLYDNKLRHFRTNVLYALITETVKHAADIDKIFDSSEILKNEPRLDPWLAKVLTAELLYGKKALPGKSKPEQTVLSYKDQFEKFATEHPAELKTEVVHRPRYVRINTNLLTTSDAIRAFQDEGYKFIRCTSGSYDDYLKQIQGLTEYDFTQDYHVKTMFVFPPGTKLHEHDLYLENQIILQDKATAMAVHLLAPQSGSVVMDMCAAPGMKTTQLAAYMRNEGKIYAVERNERRFQTLCDFVNKTGCKCVEVIHKDAFEIRRGDCDDVEYILLDPSCSGSGMELTVHNYIEDTRLAKLTSLQEKFLKHAMNAFPKAKRIVYSTCSLFPEENERVVTNVVKNSRSKWRVQDVKELLKGQWNNFGSGMYGSMGMRCLYAKPDTDLTTGFFLAVIDRDQAELERVLKGADKIVNEESNNGNTNEVERKSKKKSRTEECDVDYIDENTKRDIKKKKKSNDLENNHSTDTTIDNSLSVEEPKKKKKRKDNLNDDTSQVTPISDTSNVIDANIKKKKKKRKHGDHEDDITPANIDVSQDVETVHKDIVEIEEQAELPTLKKKKKKHKSSGNEETVTVDVNERTVSDGESMSKKKKKKDKYRECENSNNDHLEDSLQIVNDDSNADISHGVKKKKRDKHI